MRHYTKRPPLEKDIQREICEWLQIRNFFFWRSNNVPVFARNNAGKMQYRSLPKFTPRGIPDIIIICEGFFIGLEVKRPETLAGQQCFLTPDQEEFKKNVLKAGGYYYMVKCIEDVAQIPLIRRYVEDWRRGVIDNFVKDPE